MRFLLDTHIWIWSYFEPQKLTSAIARELTDPAHDRFLSPISVWEAVLLLEKNRFQIVEDFPDWFKNSTTDLNITEAPLNWEVAKEARSVELGHKDPADRLLVATARVYQYTLVTADKRLMNVDGLSVLANR